MNEISIEFEEEAEQEFFEIAHYYDQHEPELRIDFIQEIHTVTRALKEYPGIGSPYLFGTRRVLLRRFPFAVVYKMYPSEETEDYDKVVIFAIMHFRKKPGYWKTRMQ